MLTLIADPCDEDAISFLRDNNIDILLKPAISPSLLLAEISKADALMVRSRTKVTKEVIEKGKNLKVVGRIGSGFDNIDVKTCREKGITIVNAPDANSQAVAELTVGLMIAYLRQLPRAITSMKESLWIKNEIWGQELSGKTIGILGYGHVGKRVEKILGAFGAKILIHSHKYQTATLREIFQKSDIITLHLSLNEKTRGCINKRLLSEMKSDSILVNLARGELIDEDALYETLSKKKIAGAILDVYWQEPLPPDSPWRKLNNVLLTPHIGAATKEALEKASITVAEDVVRVLKGEKPKNQV
ncbi:hydroxyacid dehydrogenase [Candidatus Gottesmanbacteria bacterium]|nr:hydroxyacid dehydrogenase [Candidatus Gottesmanbacteria bacterium]